MQGHLRAKKNAAHVKYRQWFQEVERAVRVEREKEAREAELLLREATITGGGGAGKLDTLETQSSLHPPTSSVAFRW